MKNKFKSFGLVAFAIVSLTFASCGVDSEDIIGTWGCTHSVYTCENHVYPTDPDRNITEEDNDYGKIIKFNADGTYANTNEFNHGDNYIPSGGGTWMIDGDKLILSNSDTWLIKKLNKNTLLIVRETYRKYVDGDYAAYMGENGENADIVRRVELNFNRQN